ncbi:hypothetical protein V5799_023948 [Amblyomma americanum]|uniref:Reverse transcriptase domain-containing protein n=1 Tax=Amblyomma americanum TaxID=6943 RepID=A0AAQ4FH58_AMBAM
MIDRVNEELLRTERVGVLQPVKMSEWAAPIAPILKRNEQIRIRGDSGSVALAEKYPIARVEDLFARLSGGEKFTKLDLKDAYLHVQLDEATSTLLTINTPRGLYSTLACLSVLRRHLRFF